MRKILLLLSFVFVGAQCFAQTCTFDAQSNTSYTYTQLLSAAGCTAGSFTDLVVTNLSAGNGVYALQFDQDVSLNSISITFKNGNNDSPIIIPSGITVSVDDFSIAGQSDKDKVLEVDGELSVTDNFDLGGVQIEVAVGSGGSISAGSITGAGDASLTCESGGDCVAAGSCDDGTGGFCDAGGGVTPLPVEWRYVRAAYEGNLLNVEWATVQEENNERFSIEVSRDGLSWQQVKEVAGAGTTYEQQTYQANINLAGFSYLRIKQTDYDGQFDYSTIVRISGSSNAQPAALLDKIYPNPVQEELSLQLTAGSHTPVRIQVMSATGTLLMEFEVAIQAGMQQHKLQLGQLAKGTYILSIENLLTGETEVKRFHKL